MEKLWRMTYAHHPLYYLVNKNHKIKYAFKNGFLQDVGWEM